MRREGQLYQNAVDFLILIELIDGLKEFFLKYRVGKVVSFREYPGGRTGFLLHVDV